MESDDNAQQRTLWEVAEDETDEMVELLQQALYTFMHRILYGLKSNGILKNLFEWICCCIGS